MKVVVVGTRGFPGVQGGVETHCEQLYPRLVARGCEVIVFTRKPYVMGNNGVYRGVRLIPLRCPRHRHLEAFVHSLFSVLAAKRVDPDVLHVHAIGPSLVVPLARLLGMKVVMTHHGPDYERKKWGRLAKGVLRLGERLGSRWAHQMICISEPIAATVKQKYKRSPVVIPNGVAAPQRLMSQETLRRYGVEPGRYILTVGRFVPEKGFHDLIEAFGRLQAADSHNGQEGWKLVLVGRADHEDRYSQSLAQKAASASNVILTGFLTGLALQELYSHAGLFVLPSTYEGLPIALLEAMSYGSPCLVSDIPANRSVRLPEDRYVRPGDVEALTKKLSELLRMPFDEGQRREQIRRVAQDYSWERIADQTLAVYASLLDGAGGVSRGPRG